MKQHHTIASLALAAGLWLNSGTTTQAAAENESAAADRKACLHQLEQIHTAIQAYRKDHKDLPNWLSDLAPKYIQDKDQLICPIARRTGQSHPFTHLNDPKLPRSYLYEFSPLPMGNVWAGGNIRMRDFKRRQMGLLGGEVPIVRCHLHSPVLNLAFSGKVYESGMNWEENFTDLVEMSAHEMQNLFPDARPAGTPARQPVMRDAEDSGPKTLVGSAAPLFTLATLDGGTFDLEAHKGKQIVLLDFWATWCGPCRDVMPALAEVARDYADKGVRYYAVNLQEKPEAIRRYLTDAKLQIAVPLDKDGSVAKKYAVRGIPTMVIVGKDGTVKKVHVGSSPTVKADLSRELDELIAQP